MRNTPPPTSAPLQALIIGAGFGGLGMAIQLRKAGLEDFLLLEKAEDVGGCWRDNHYPGAACDVPSHLYSFSFEPKADWSRRFAPRAEILDYLRHCADKYGLRSRIRFGQEVSAARFDEASGVWEVSTATGELLRTRVLISACGQLSRPAWPRLTGLERFEGPRFHSARWRHDVVLEGKRVAVIGTGASAIQFVPPVASRVQRLFLFQRSAPYVIPRPDRAYRPWEHALLRRVPWLQKLSRTFTYLQYEARVLGFFTFPVVMKLLERRFRRLLEREIAHPELRRKLTPDYPMGCKRILISNDYYAALSRPNVEVVSETIREVTARGVVTADGREHEVDALIFGTGFTATEFLSPMRVFGRGGRELNEVWREGAEAYLGVTVSGFPNFFMLYGPNTNLGHNSIVFMLESQIRYVLACMRVLREHHLRFLDVRPDAQRDFNARLQQALHHSVWEGGCTSWYKTAEGKNTNNWPGFTFLYRRHTRAPKLAHYDRQLGSWDTGTP
ncbi:MAG TPA: NAD(P)/FAD-dependent oxidoreductase [Archangium sp.]|uniref:flavin-containing monooxygenase n=1 Tax=Archangium sp. TaxID=1872627 RepID=UPI002ED8BABD